MNAQKKMDFWFSALYGEKKVVKMEEATVFLYLTKQQPSRKVTKMEVVELSDLYMVQKQVCVCLSRELVWRFFTIAQYRGANFLRWSSTQNKQLEP